MNSTLEAAYTLFGNFVEAFVALTCEVTDLVLTTLNVNTSVTTTQSPDTSSSTPVVDSNEATAAATEKVVASEWPQFIQDLLPYFEFDDFQYLLLKIFLGVFIVNCCFIWVAWYIYGERITENFLTDSPNIPPEELKRRITELNLPRVHSQRY